MTENMIAPDSWHPTNDLRHAAERSAALVTSVVTGRHRAVADLAADLKGELVVPARRRNIDLSTPAGRIRHGYLGGEARNALADLFESLDEVDTAEWPLGLVALREAARQALRLSALADDELPQCLSCDALRGRVQELEHVCASAAEKVAAARGRVAAVRSGIDAVTSASGSIRGQL